MHLSNPPLFGAYPLLSALVFSVPRGHLSLIGSHKWEGKHSFLLENTFSLQWDNPSSFYSFLYAQLVGENRIKHTSGKVCRAPSSMLRVSTAPMKPPEPTGSCDSILISPLCNCSSLWGNTPWKPSAGRLGRHCVLFTIFINNSLDDGMESTLIKFTSGTTLGVSANTLDNRTRIEMSSTNCKRGLEGKKNKNARHETEIIHVQRAVLQKETDDGRKGQTEPAAQ